MAIVATAVVNQASYKSWTFTALDADVALALPHGFGVAPDAVIVTPIGAAIALAAGGNWSVSSVDATNINLAKLNTAGSGGTTPGTTVILKVVALRPNSGMQG